MTVLPPDYPPKEPFPPFGSLEHREWIARRLSANLRLRRDVEASLDFAARLQGRRQRAA